MPILSRPIAWNLMTHTSLFVGVCTVGTLFCCGMSQGAENLPQVRSPSNSNTREQSTRPGDFPASDAFAQNVPEFNNDTVRDRKKKIKLPR